MLGKRQEQSYPLIWNRLLRQLRRLRLYLLAYCSQKHWMKTVGLQNWKKEENANLGVSEMMGHLLGRYGQDSPWLELSRKL